MFAKRFSNSTLVVQTFSSVYLFAFVEHCDNAQNVSLIKFDLFS